MAAKKPKKKQAIRNNEYYDTQECFDRLYRDSQQGKRFTKLMGLITSEENIMLAYCSIKKNKGSKTKGVNNSTIVQMGEKNPRELVSYVQRRLQNFRPHAVRRVEIPKPDGRLRPLGIPTIEDRIIQQCIKQVLEPICEAKFYKQKWLMERLGLEISPEKSKIVNLKKRWSDFLGFKLKLRPKGGKWVVKSQLTEKALLKCKDTIREAIKRIGRKPSAPSVMQFNATVLGLHNYYKVATYVYTDFDRIAFDVRKCLLCRTKRYRSNMGLRSQAFQQFYGDFHGKIFYVAKLALFPINGIKTRPPMCFSQDICNYTEVGRAKIHSLQNAVNLRLLRQLMENPIQGASIELNDNRTSMFVAQHGKCAVSKESLTLGNMVVHHITPKQAGGGDNYANLILVTPDVHQLIHAKAEETVQKYLNKLKSCKLNMARLNRLRELAGNCKIANR